MNKKVVALLILSPFAWFSILISISLRMMHWRSVNEPGVPDSRYAGLLTAHYLAFWIGLALTVLIQVFVRRWESDKLIISWIANVAATVVYIPLFFITLLMMV